MSTTSAFTDRVAVCGGCGAELVFEVGSSQVKVCGFCQYVSVRTLQGIEGRGKVAEVVPTGARLAQGAVGTFEGVPFRLAGRLQLGWAQGAWDEWYVAFDDGRWGWIAEAGGRYYISFHSVQRNLPPFQSMRPGFEARLPGVVGRLVVTDVRHARYTGASGELPEEFPLDGSSVRLVDLSGEKGAFATFDFGRTNDTQPTVFVGREVTLHDLHVATEHLNVERSRARARELICPHCKAPLELFNPDEAVHVTCSHCASLLNVGDGALAFVAALQKPRFQWRLGSRSHFDGVEYRVAGWMQRECRVDGETYTWEEYLLYNPVDSSYRYLLLSDGHWSFVTPIAAGDVTMPFGSATWNGTAFKPFSRVLAAVRTVWGEFPWAVERGETVFATDYIAPPEGLSQESSDSEVVWSHSRYLTPREVWDAFGLSDEAPPTPDGVAPLQPNAWTTRAKETARFAGVACVAAVLVFVLLAMRSTGTQLLEMKVPLQAGYVVGGAEPIALPPEVAGEPNATSVVFSHPFHIPKSRRNLRIQLETDVANSWVWVQGALVDEATGEVRSFNLESSDYWGRDSDGAWRENNLKKTKYLSSMPEGEWVLRAEAQWPRDKPAPVVSLKVSTNVVRGSHFFFVILLLLLPPGFFALRAAMFEGKRWEQASGAD